MSGKGMKRQLEDDNLEKSNDYKQKRANLLCEQEVEKSTKELEIAINKMTPDERILFTRLFKFPVIASNQQ